MWYNGTGSCDDHEITNLFADFFHGNFATDSSPSINIYQYRINDSIDVSKAMISQQNVLQSFK